MELCSSCNSGHTLINNLCQGNVCTCSNGAGATGTNCPSHNSAKCVSCNSGFILEGTVCNQEQQAHQGCVGDYCASSDLINTCKASNAGPIDVVFVLDGSGSVKEDPFYEVVEWLRSVASALDVGPSATRVAVTQYSSEQDVEFNFISNPSQLVNAFNGIEYMDGKGTHTGVAIAHAYDEVLRNARGGVRRVMVVVTDGKSSDDPSTEADALRDRNIDVLAVGFVKYKEEQLEDICDCNNYITGDDVDDLLNQVEAIARQVCD
jgi:uncharacterized protein YegL